jgi:hypothetical protein
VVVYTKAHACGTRTAVCYIAPLRGALDEGVWRCVAWSRGSVGVWGAGSTRKRGLCGACAGRHVRARGVAHLHRRPKTTQSWRRW